MKRKTPPPPTLMGATMIPLASIKPNDKNPRKIRDERLQKLAESIERLPAMMELRPIVVDEAGVVIGGSMRVRALGALGYTEIPSTWVRSAANMTPEERRRFIIADNVSFGTWDEDLLVEEYNHDELLDMGLDQYGIAPMSEADLAGFFDEPKPAAATEPEIKVMVLHFSTDDHAAVTATTKAMGKTVEHVLLAALGIEIKQ